MAPYIILNDFDNTYEEVGEFPSFDDDVVVEVVDLESDLAVAFEASAKEKATDDTKKSTRANVAKLVDLETSLAAAFEASAKEKEANSVGKAANVIEDRKNTDIKNAIRPTHPLLSTTEVAGSSGEKTGDGSAKRRRDETIGMVRIGSHIIRVQIRNIGVVAEKLTSQMDRELLYEEVKANIEASLRDTKMKMRVCSDSTDEDGQPAAAKRQRKL